MAHTVEDREGMAKARRSKFIELRNVRARILAIEARSRPSNRILKMWRKKENEILERLIDLDDETIKMRMGMILTRNMSHRGEKLETDERKQGGGPRQWHS